jgi:hypothetical protein
MNTNTESGMKKSDQIKENVYQFFQSNTDSAWHLDDIDLSYTKTQIYFAIRELFEDDKLSLVKLGRKKLYSIKDSEVKSLSCTIEEPKEEKDWSPIVKEMTDKFRAQKERENLTGMKGRRATKDEMKGSKTCWRPDIFFGNRKNKIAKACCNNCPHFEDECGVHDRKQI